MTTLVTGASGFVGRHLVGKLLARGAAVRALVRDPAAADALRARGLEALVGDVRDPAALREAVRGAGVIHHCAAAVGPRYSAREINEVNGTGVANLLEAVRQAGAGRVVLLSSVNVLGTRNLDPATEDLPYRTSGDPAADVKIEAERLALDYHRRHGLDVVILRPGLIYGPGEPHVPRMLDALRRGKFAFVGSRANVVPLVHVADVVRAMLLAAEAPAARGRVYHITDGSRTTVGELADHLAGLIGCPPPRRLLPYAVPYLGCLLFELLGRLGLRRGPAPITRAGLRFLGTSRFVDIRRAKQELGYAPLVDFRQGMAATVRWIEGHPHDRPDPAGTAA
jgi:2-alkyl-3-oxoalkanoate reductase